METEHWVLKAEHWILGTGHWTLDTGYWKDLSSLQCPARAGMLGVIGASDSAILWTKGRKLSVCPAERREGEEELLGEEEF